jgi:hypothetical protein
MQIIDKYAQEIVKNTYRYLSTTKQHGDAPHEEQQHLKALGLKVARVETVVRLIGSHLVSNLWH